jgi:hypothetical protein
MLILAFLSLPFVAAGQSRVLTLLGGESVEITCDGQKLTASRENVVKFKVNCKPGRESTTPTMPPTSGPTVESFTLVNAETNEDIGPLANGAIIDLAGLPTRNLNVRANTNLASVGSVRFGLDENLDYKLDNMAPYALADDIDGDYQPWTLTVGAHTLSAVAYSANNGSGAASVELRISFRVVDKGGDPVPTPTPPLTASVPLCPDHNPTQWHGLVDTARGCHYDHTHNWDPAVVDDLLGPAGSLWGGQSISYPWETNHENHHKHSGYKYGLNRDLGCEFAGMAWMAENCIDAFRVQYHSAGQLDLAVRFHSYFLEARICIPDGRTCGVARTGGWADFGILKAPYPGTWVPLPGQDPPVVSELQTFIEPYRTDNPIRENDFNNLEYYRQLALSGKGSASKKGFGFHNQSYWSTDYPVRNQYGYNQTASFKFWIFDDPALIDRGDPFNPVLICPNYDCLYNNSEHLVFEVTLKVSEELDTDGDGVVTYSGYTDRQGNIVQGCTAPGLDCVPLSFEDVPVGIAAWGTGSDIGLETVQPGGVVGPVDFDVSPDNEWWITHPN